MFANQCWYPCLGPLTASTNYLKCFLYFPSTRLANQQWLFNRPIMVQTQILVHSWDPEQGFWCCSVDGLNQKFTSICGAGCKESHFKACRSGKVKLAYTRPNTISTSPKNISMSSISQFFCNLNYCKNFTSVQQPMTLHYKSLKESNWV